MALIGVYLAYTNSPGSFKTLYSVGYNVRDAISNP